MIAICEPQCIGFAHEAVNSGFIYCARLAFPDEKIIFFDDLSHIQAIQKMFIINNIEIKTLTIDLSRSNHSLILIFIRPTIPFFCLKICLTN